MPDRATRIVVVKNQQGLHARAAIAIAKTAREFRSKVELVRDHQRATCGDVMQILLLGAPADTQLVLEADGPDAEQALDALTQLFADRFGEES